MKEIGIAAITLSVTALIVLAGVSGKKVLFINGPRSAVITLGIIGMLFCTISVGRFITAAPAHPLTIMGYLFGSLALLAFLTQIFQWKIPYLQDPATALYIMAACILVKTIVGRFIHFVS
jgi:hypothetical protein